MLCEDDGSVVWAKILNRFPEVLKKEILDERPNGTQEDIKELSSWHLRSMTPVNIGIAKLLSKTENLESISRTPPNVVNTINKKWGLNVKPGKIYDKTPGRYEQYSKMPSATAGPSIMVNGEIYWGIGRFIAALLRGDKTIKIWDIRSKL